MHQHPATDKLRGCYVALPTMFTDDDLSVDLEAMQRHVEFLIDGGMRSGSAILLAGGAAGDFTTLTLEERVQVTDMVARTAAGRVPVAMGVQND